MRAILGVIVLLVIPAAVAGEETRDERIAKFLNRCDGERKAELAKVPDRIKAETLLLGRIKSGRITPGVGHPPPWTYGPKSRIEFVSKEAKLEHIELANKRVVALKELQKQLAANDPPYVASIDHSRPLKVGDLGRNPTFMTIETIIDEDEMIVRQGGPRSIDAGPFWLKGFPTEGKADGAKFTVGDCIEVTGTKSYTTVLGAKKTVLVIEPFDVVSALARKAAEQND